MPNSLKPIAAKLAQLIHPKHRSSLVYSSDANPGIRRLRKGSGFAYADAAGRPLRTLPILQRIRSLAIPPAWTQVWICRQANGHLQATGRDARGRKQYRYHPEWRELRDRTKYDRLTEVAAVLPRLRRRVERDLRGHGLTKQRVLATVVRALETTLIRVGNDEYARTNGSYGLTTLRNGHAKVKGSEVQFRFRGKSGKQHVIECNDARLANIVKGCQELPGRELFGYVDERGQARDITSTDVNNYLREVTGQDITAKDFRTWAGTLLAAKHLSTVAKSADSRPTKRAVAKAVEAVAQQLGNTKAICQKCYIHPVVLETFLDGTILTAYRHAPTGASGLRSDEVALVHLLNWKPKATRAKKAA